MVTRRTLLSLSLAPALWGQPEKKAPRMFADAGNYERYMGRWSRLLAPQLVDFTGVEDKGRYLDVGCGTGALAFALAEKNPHSEVRGIDPSEEFVAYANSKNRFHSRVSFAVGDAQKMHFGAGSFDSSLALLVFNFIPDPVKAIHEVRRVTRPGGKVSASVWDYGEGMGMLRAFWDSAVRLDPKAEALDEKHMRLCHAGELSALWREGGLENVHEQPHEIAMKFENFADYWDGFLLGTGPAGAYAKSLDGAHLAELRGALKARLSPAAENVPVNLKGRVWSVCGTVPRGKR